MAFIVDFTLNLNRLMAGILQEIDSNLLTHLKQLQYIKVNKTIKLAALTETLCLVVIADTSSLSTCLCLPDASL